LEGAGLKKASGDAVFVRWAVRKRSSGVEVYQKNWFYWREKGSSGKMRVRGVSGNLKNRDQGG